MGFAKSGLLPVLTLCMGLVLSSNATWRMQSSWGVSVYPFMESTHGTLVGWQFGYTTPLLFLCGGNDGFGVVIKRHVVPTEGNWVPEGSC
jgi:hypothetical protein